MNIKEVKDLIQEILQSDISEFELEQTGTKIKLRRERRGVHAVRASGLDPMLEAQALEPQLVTVERVSPPPAAPEEQAENGLHIITSPIVGTFYRAPSPGAESYVKIGDAVEEGKILCIVEAMKLMNEIPSDTAGVIEKIYVENGHPVEYGQRLFGIRPRK
jgi:acetyl-CoA carboxylase biotin carboxyl carrier protein